MRAYSLKGRGEGRKRGRKGNNRDKAERQTDRQTDRQTRSENRYLVEFMAQVYTADSIVKHVRAFTCGISTVQLL